MLDHHRRDAAAQAGHTTTATATATTTATVAPTDSAAVPAVVGRRLGAARSVLEQAGFTVHEVVRRDCRLVGRVTATSPAPGTPTRVGSTVTLTYSDATPTGSCAYLPEERAWDFLDWAREHGSPPPLFTSDLGDLKSPPATWEHAADIARTTFALLPTGGGGSAQPALTASYEKCPPLADCNVATWLRVTLTLDEQPYAEFTLPLLHGLIAGYRLESGPTSPTP